MHDGGGSGKLDRGMDGLPMGQRPCRQRARGKISKRPRRNHSPVARAKVALSASKGEKTLAGMAQRCDVPPNLINQCWGRLLEQVVDVFGSVAANSERWNVCPVAHIRRLHPAIRVRLGLLDADAIRSSVYLDPLIAR